MKNCLQRHLESMQFSNNDETIEMYAEIILHDVLHKVFSYLSIYDLNQAASVCKSWHNSAKIEKFRRGPQVMVLQALEDVVATKFSNLSPAHKNEPVDDYKLALRIKPRAGIFFTDGKYPATADCDNVPYEICKTHRWTRPVDCFYVSIEALGVKINDNTIGGERNITAAIFLPELPGVDYAITETSSHAIEQYFRSGGSLLTDLIDNLFVEGTDHTCFFIFLYQWKDEPTYENYHSNFLNIVLNAMKNRYAPGTYSLWGGAINDIFTIAADEKLPYHSTSFCAMGISGPSVMSWSIVIDYKMEFLQVEEKLQDFRRNIRLQTSSIAFLLLPATKHDADGSRTEIFKKVFPTVTLICILNDRNNAALSLDSTSIGMLHTVKNDYANRLLANLSTKGKFGSRTRI